MEEKETKKKNWIRDALHRKPTCSLPPMITLLQLSYTFSPPSKKQTTLTLSILSSPFGTTAPFSPKSAQPFLVSSKLSAANPALFYLVATYSHPCDLERGCSKRPNEVAKRGLVSDSANSMELACYMVLHSWPETSRGSVHGEDNRLA